MNDPAGSQALEPVPPLQLPPDTPAEVVQTAWENVLQMTIANLNKQAIEVDFEFVDSLTESTRVASEFKVTGKLRPIWNQNGLDDVISVINDYGWKAVDYGAV